MQDSNHLTISRKLAKSIGWASTQVDKNGRLWVNDVDGIGVGIFDYRDWNVIGPIAERFELEVDFMAVGARDPHSLVYYYRDTVQESIAACVIAAQGVK